MRILVTGGRGQLGSALRKALSGHELFTPGHQDLDITRANLVASTFDALRPQLVIHTAAWTDTQGCERYPEKAHEVNVEGTRWVARTSAAVGAAVVYISSNEVFDGVASEPYPEDAEPNPLNAYARTKLEGEREVEQALERHYIVRTAWLYGAGRASFPEKIIAAARKQGSLKVVTDEIASPTWTQSLAEAISRLIEEPAWGTYHLTGAGWCSRLEWAQAVLELAGLGDVPIEPTTLAEFGSPYLKPPFSALANRNAASLGIELPPWQEPLAAYFASLKAS